MPELLPSDVVAIIEKALRLKAGTLTLESRAQDVAPWDSLGQLSILVALDRHFSGKVAAMSEMAEADSVHKIVGILQAHGLL